MDFKKLFKKQGDLDNFILQKRDVEGRDLFKEKLLALLVEIGELANATRCFKYWSLQEAKPREEILEEFADCMHFLLSLGNMDKRYIKFSELLKHYVISDDKEYSTPELILRLYEAVVEFGKLESPHHYSAIWLRLLQLGERLGFTEKEIEEAYERKNDINYARMKSGY